MTTVKIYRDKNGTPISIDIEGEYQANLSLSNHSWMYCTVIDGCNELRGIRILVDIGVDEFNLNNKCNGVMYENLLNGSISMSLCDFL